MKKAVIAISGHQYLVSEGQSITIDRLSASEKSPLITEALLVIDGKATAIGTPHTNSKVTLEVTEPEVLGDKVVAIRYKPKKRVRKVRGHRQKQTTLTVKKIG
jgi:large subunit ribosomal protein L21